MRHVYQLGLDPHDVPESADELVLGHRWTGEVKRLSAIGLA
jgi:hypothetical protein